MILDILIESAPRGCPKRRIFDLASLAIGDGWLTAQILEPYGLSWQKHVASLDLSGLGMHASDLIDLWPEGNGVRHIAPPAIG